MRKDPGSPECSKDGDHTSVSALTGHTNVMEAKILDSPDCSDFRKLSILGIFRWDLGSGRVCNRLEMAVGFKWTDSQLTPSHMAPFSKIFKISIMLVLIRLV